MKRIVYILIISLPVFFFLTFFTGENNLAGDGKNELGFPLVFETEYANMIDSSSNRVEFNNLHLSVDIVFALTVAFLIWLLTTLIFKKLN